VSKRPTRPLPAPTGADLLVNCTSVGLLSADVPDRVEPSAIQGGALNQLALTFDQVSEYSHVIDLAYRSQSTPLLAAAEAQGVPTTDGLEVLVAQGALSLELWTRRRAPRELMLQAARGEPAA
jgi:shikimate dehydrogenase